ncbi:MAG: hypothetical protein GX446_14340 [Chthonomonadales bacterium]|nr:hypothetical protein [Chthonomonadales bacterium]
MDIRDLFPKIAAAGVTLRVVDGALRAGPVEALTDELRAAIREHREALLAARCQHCGEPTAGYGFCDAHDPFADLPAR